MFAGALAAAAMLGGAALFRWPPTVAPLRGTAGCTALFAGWAAVGGLAPHLTTPLLVGGLGLLVAAYVANDRDRTAPLWGWAVLYAALATGMALGRGHVDRPPPMSLAAFEADPSVRAAELTDAWCLPARQRTWMTGDGATRTVHTAAALSDRRVAADVPATTWLSPPPTGCAVRPTAVRWVERVGPAPAEVRFIGVTHLRTARGATLIRPTAFLGPQGVVRPGPALVLLAAFGAFAWGLLGVPLVSRPLGSEPRAIDGAWAHDGVTVDLGPAMSARRRRVLTTTGVTAAVLGGCAAAAAWAAFVPLLVGLVGSTVAVAAVPGIVRARRAARTARVLAVSRREITLTAVYAGRSRTVWTVPTRAVTRCDVVRDGDRVARFAVHTAARAHTVGFADPAPTTVDLAAVVSEAVRGAHRVGGTPRAVPTALRALVGWRGSVAARRVR